MVTKMLTVEGLAKARDGGMVGAAARAGWRGGGAVATAQSTAGGRQRSRRVWGDAGKGGHNDGGRPVTAVINRIAHGIGVGLLLKRAMPISIQSNLPHIVLQFGANLDCPNCPSIRCAVNLCAALTTGNFHFFALVAKRFPHCVAKIYTPKDYAPIVLSGILQSNEESVMTKLEVGLLFHLPYRTREGNS